MRWLASLNYDTVKKSVDMFVYVQVTGPSHSERRPVLSLSVVSWRLAHYDDDDEGDDCLNLKNTNTFHY